MKQLGSVMKTTFRGDSNYGRISKSRPLDEFDL